MEVMVVDEVVIVKFREECQKTKEWRKLDFVFRLVFFLIRNPEGGLSP